MLKVIIVAAIYTPIFAQGLEGNPYITAAKLGSLAQSSALQAQSLVGYQRVVGTHAAFSAQNGLAQTALSAASTAQAALLSRKKSIETLKKRLKEAEKTLEDGISQYETLQKIASAFDKTARESLSQVDALQVIIEAAKNKTESVLEGEASGKSSENADISFGSFNIV